MSAVITRESGNAPALSGATLRPEVLSRRTALGAAAAITLSLVTMSAASAGVVAPQVAVTAPASSDADLIALAERLTALSRRCDAAVDRRIDLEDRVFKLCPMPKPMPQPKFGESITETRTPTGRILHVTQSFEPNPARVQWEADTAAARAVHEQQVMEAEGRLGLPELKRRCERMGRRRDRWADELAAARPATAAGLAAKTSAVLALLGPDTMSRDREMEVSHRADLVLSVLADVVRLGAGAVA